MGWDTGRALARRALTPVPDSPAASIRSRIRRKLGRTLNRVRRSMSLRVSLVTALALGVILAMIGIYVSSSIRGSMFKDKVEQSLGDASWRINQIQLRLDQASAATVEQVQGTAQEVIRNLQEPGSGIIGAMLLRSPNEQSSAVILEPITNARLRDLVSDQLRQRVKGSSGLFWQSVEIPAPGRSHPGIVVGREVTVPLAGTHEIYLIYTLESEQQTINRTMTTFAGAGFALIVLVGVIIWVILWRVLNPVRQAALTAERLAAGVLDARLEVRGTDELAVLAHSFNEMAGSLRSQIHRLEDLSRLQQRFVSDVSHELRTPLTTIRMASDMLFEARITFDPVTRRSAELLAAQLDRFESMLADLLEISRIDAGAVLTNAEEQDLRPVVRKVAELAAPLAERNKTTIRLHGMDEPVTAAIDERRVERIIRNLVINAIEHAQGSPVDLTIASGMDAVAVRVTDTGLGLSRETAAHVFDRFWRADPARARTSGGTGLGLSIAQEDARLHGGTLEAWGEEGVVASFLLTLPKRPGEGFSPPLSLIPPGMGEKVSATGSGQELS